MPDDDEINCETCIAACCRAGMEIMLTREEYEEHQEVMKHKVVWASQPFGRMLPTRSVVSGGLTVLPVMPHHTIIRLREDCGHLDGNKCSVYPDRPSACRAFEMGGPGCRAARAVAFSKRR